MNTYKIGIAGCGWISNHAHIRAIQQIPEVCIESIYDKHESPLNNTGDKYNIQNRYTVFSQFLESDIKAVVLATPNYTHKDFIIKTLLSEKWLLCEKPIVLNESELLEIKEKVGDKIGYFVPAFVNRFRHDIKLLFSELKNIGSITRIKAKWIRRNGVPRPGTWFTNNTLSGGGVLIDLGPHMIDICLNIIKTVSHTEDPDLFVQTKDLQFIRSNHQNHFEANWFLKSDDDSYEIDVENKIHSKIQIYNVMIDLELCWSSETSNDYTQFTVYGTNATLQLDTLFGFSTCKQFSHAKITTFKNNIKTEQSIPEHLNTQISAFAEMHSYFKQCINSKKNNALTIDDAEMVTKTIDAIYEM